MSDQKDEENTSPQNTQHITHQQQQQQQQQQLLFHTTNPPTISTTTTTTFSPFNFESSSKKPRYTTTWKPQPSLVPGPGPGPVPAHSSPPPGASPETPSSSSAPHHAAASAAASRLRKGKYVSPVWRPDEMLCLARAWRAQYEGPGPGPGGPGGPARGKTRAEKDREVAEYLARHGVSRDAKTAGTKWDNMLGEFRKVYEWERYPSSSVDRWGPHGQQAAGNKSYFRLSPYERKIHRLPASFDEQVFEELSQFMGPRMRPTSSCGITTTTTTTTNTSSVGTASFLQFQQGLLRSSSSGGGSGGGSFEYGGKAMLPPSSYYPSSIPSFIRDDEHPLSTLLSARTRTMEEYTTRINPRSNPLLGYDQYQHQHQHLSPHLDYGPTLGGSRVEMMRRMGRIRMSWEESVSLWGPDDTTAGDSNSRGRVKLYGGGGGSMMLFNADELVYFDESMVASTLEFFEEGPLKGFSVDSFVPGQLLKVFGRRKHSSSSSTSSGVIERFSNPNVEPSTRWELFQDPTDYYLGCLRTLPGTLPSLIELPWYIQELPPEEFRIPLRKDIYRDLPQGRELFFTVSSSEPPFLDSKSFTLDILSSLIRSNPSISASTSTSRDSYIGLWDDCINRVVSKFCPIEMVFIRKQNNKAKPSSETVLDEWPNLTGMVNKLCLWRGEEVDRVREDDDPSNSITRNLLWTYGDLPYVLGYYAIGHNVTFCALSPSQNKSEIIRTDLYSVDLSDPSDRLKSIIPCWRIGILLATLASRCSTSSQSDYYRQEIMGDDSNGNVIIEMTPNTVTKCYPSKKKWQKVKEIYDMLDQNIPHVEHVICHNEIDLSLVFKPRGVKIRPKNCNQLVLALKQVTKSLVALHDLSFMHRDLSWDKVMLLLSQSKDEDEGQDEDEDKEWFVTGFEEAVRAPRINPSRLAKTDEEKGGASGRHAPEMARGVYGVKVDVWGIGYLVKTSGVQVSKSEESVVGKKLRELEMRCMEQNPEMRPTAADCYHHLLQIQASLSFSSSSASPACI